MVNVEDISVTAVTIDLDEVIIKKYSNLTLFLHSWGYILSCLRKKNRFNFKKYIHFFCKTKHKHIIGITCIADLCELN